jgi:hypothetical protein
LGAETKAPSQGELTTQARANAKNNGMSGKRTLYEQDFLGWSNQQAALRAAKIG